MKKTLILLTILFTFNLAQSQNYKYGAAFASNFFVKMTGNIKVNDSLVTISGFDKNNIETTNTYTFVKTANRITYFTDGVTMYSMTISSETGKKKGFEYDTLIIWRFDATNYIMYYCKKED
jgi:hypothetical protein